MSEEVQYTTEGSETVQVTWENFPRSQLHEEMERFAEWGGFGTFHHFRTLFPLDQQVEAATNRDTLYSIGVFDLTEPVTITKPDAGDRYQSMIVLNEDQYVKLFVYDAGEYTLTQDDVGTRYACVLVRTFVDPNDPDDVETAHRLQDGLTVSQDSPGTLELPHWNRTSHDELFDALVTVGQTMDDFRGACGDVGEVHPMKFLLQSVTTFGFPESEAFYLTRTPDLNDGETPQTLTVEDVPVDAFWSVTVYNGDWYLEENEYDAYVVNNVTAERDDDGSVTIHFGGDPDQPNFIYTPEDWSYMVRLYRPRESVLDGSYRFPEPRPVDGSQVAHESEARRAVPVTWENFQRAQFELFWEDFIAQNGGFGELYHYRDLTPIEGQEAMPRQPNRDTLYSVGVFDLTEPLTISKPDTGDRYQSIEVDNQDEYQKRVFYDPGEYTVTRDDIGTRYVALGVRTFVDPNDPDDLRRARTLQDEIVVRQDSVGAFELANWDRDSFEELREALTTIGKTMDDLRGAYGDVDDVDPVKHLLASALYKWGGLAESEAFYLTRTPDQNDGETPQILTVEDVPVDGFWSISVYNREFYFEENESDAYSVNDVTAAKNDDGSVTVHFGGDPTQPNFLYTPADWNYVVRLYRPHEEVLDGSYQFPEAQPVE